MDNIELEIMLNEIMNKLDEIMEFLENSGVSENEYQ